MAGLDWRLPSFPMCQSDYFEVSYVINPWMAGNLGNVIEVDVSEFMKSGGSCKCLTLAL
jgi:hypothetical protein